jgi:hypothetical protein
MSQNIKSNILRNLREVAGAAGKISRSQYRTSRKRQFASSTVEEHFGSFTAARKAARLKSVN